ncbi:phosphoesterase PA-phosphatase [Methanococcus aeolicus]|uniref:phosphoesterase PA-phosphatase n=1 Tax=Methanococcus aeolicus TaxID=42879 RepID=UPI0021C949F7|nr:phosphoesterase PA-phosphatase [Methanococcus aeolicus]UXM84500.1 phosphoesterase PA-phosphatase [Methanococcus aeolicus]
MKQFAEIISNLFPYWFIISMTLLFKNIVEIILIGALPFIVWVIYAKLKNQQWDIEDRAPRIMPLILLICYGFLIYPFIDHGYLTMIFFINLIIISTITVFWKISIHCYGSSTILILLAHKYYGDNTIFFIALVFNLLILISTMWARLYLNRHTKLQVGIGTLLGLIINIVLIGTIT